MISAVILAAVAGAAAAPQKPTPGGRVRVALAKQPFSPTGPSKRPATIGFATLPARDEGGLSIAAVNRMLEAAVRGAIAR